MECMIWTRRIVPGSPSEISSRTIGLGFVCTLFPISQHALQQNVDFVGIGNRAHRHPYLWSIALLIIVFIFFELLYAFVFLKDVASIGEDNPLVSDSCRYGNFGKHREIVGDLVEHEQLGQMQASQ